MLRISTFLTGLLICLCSIVNAQVSEGLDRHQNEVGTDIILLVDRLINFSDNDDLFIYYYYNPQYAFTYKRHFNRVSLRAAVGGNQITEDLSFDNDDESRTRSRGTLHFRLGIERPVIISDRWNFYYGIDGRYSYSILSDNGGNFNGEWSRGYDRQSNTIGLSPLIGIEFRITERIALQTEGSFLLYFESSSDTPIIRPLVDNPTTPMPSTAVEKDRELGQSFNVPSFLVLSFRL